MKNDKGKLRWDLLPIIETEQVVKVLTHGSIEYADNNWQRVVKENPDRYYGACLRHISAWRKGEILDPQTKLPHIAHAICCLNFILWNDNQKNRKKPSTG